MSQLIEALKKDHAVIVATLAKVKKLGITTKEGQETLLLAKKGLLAHLKKEDEALYPVLREKAENDAPLKRTLAMYASDMSGISKAALDFFEKYSNGGSGVEFARDFGRLSGTLSIRITKEENILYKGYEALEQN